MMVDDAALRGPRNTDFKTLIPAAPLGVAAPTASLSERARELFLRPDTARMGRRNRLSNFTFAVFAIAGGSGASVIAALLGSWALIGILVGRFRPDWQVSDRPIVLSSVVFFLVISTSDLVHSELGRALLSIAALLPFVIPVVLVPRMRLSRFADTLPPAFFGAAIGGLLLIPIVLLEYAFVEIRVQGLSGNPGPLSVTALLCAGWSILHFQRGLNRWHLLIALLGAVGGSLAVVLSGMRGTWPLLPLCIGIALFAQRREIAAVWRDSPFATRLVVSFGIVAVIGAVLVVAMPTVFTRIDQMWSDLGLIAANADSPTSLNLRRGMYGAAVEAISARPLFGYGAEAHWEAVTPYLNQATFEGMTFTHFHNVVLTVGVDAGLFGIVALLCLVAAPVVTAWRARGTLGGGRRLAAAMILVVAFFGAGMTNVMLFHDILDAVWVFCISLIAASVPAVTGRGAEVRQEG
ncbi:MAG: O-antigen ligase family protein [Rhizobiaceae bacterium]|nr:O-antigen ligase family protein [Rhizobiaceae bacterium]